MVVSADQIAKAKARGLVNVEGLAAACEHHSFPFYLACTICERETRGRNIFGHDHGGAFSDPDGRNIEVTEARYKEFLRLIGAGKTSNGVGPMQLTYKGYHIGPQSLTARGLKAWEPADNLFYGVEILAKSLKRNYDLGMSTEKAFWQAAKSYNGNSSYADDAQDRARMWLTIVGNADTKPTDPGDEDMPISDVDLAKLRAVWQADLAKVKGEVVNELFTEANKKRLAGAVWQTDGVIPSSDPTDDKWKAQTFLQLIYKAVKKP